MTTKAKQQKLSRGMRVKIYQWPYTREEFEGVAVLRILVNNDIDLIPPSQTWEVRFVDDPDDTFNRIIAIPADVVD